MEVKKNNISTVKNLKLYHKPQIEFVDLRAEEGLACTGSPLVYEPPHPVFPLHPIHPPHPTRPRKKWRF